MGNFYANVTLRSTDTEAIVQTLTSQRRRALVAPAIAGSTVIFDEAIEEGGPRELGRFAAEPSRCQLPEGVEESDLRRVG